MGKSGKERRAIMRDYLETHDLDSAQSPLNTTFINMRLIWRNIIWTQKM